MWNASSPLGDTMELEYAYASAELSDDSVYDTDAERCGICMDVIIDRGLLDCCQHCFCFACIDNWATITNLCPLCQNEFQLITCVPVYDTIGSGKVEDDSVSRDDDWCVQGTNNTLSFPSYYIDENAVICLDGNGCKIRNGLDSCGDDSNLDTSIACDSCDIWYHAFCVDFDPESTSDNSWLCPRCIDEIPQKSDGLSLQMANNRQVPETASREHSVEASHSGNVSVSVADAGETAVVVSMIEGKHWIKESHANCTSDEDINKNKGTLDMKSCTKSYVDAEENPLTLSLSQDIRFTVDSLHLNELGTDLADEAVTDQNVSENCKLFTSLLSDKPNSENVSSEIESGIDLHLGLSMGTSLPADNIRPDAIEIHKSEVSQPQNAYEVLSISVDKMAPEVTEDAFESSCLERKSMVSSDHVVGIGHSEVDNTCTRNEMVADPPTNDAKDDGKTQQNRLKDDERKLIQISSQECSHSVAGPEDQADSVDTRGDEMVAEVPAKNAKVDGKVPQTHLKDDGRKLIQRSSQEFSLSLAGSEDQVDSIDTRNETVAEVTAKKAEVDGKAQQTLLKDDGRKFIQRSSHKCSHSRAGPEDQVDSIDAGDEMVAKVPVKKAKVDGKSHQIHIQPEVNESIPGGIQECIHPSVASEDNKFGDAPEQEDSTPNNISVLYGSNRRHSAGVPYLNPAEKGYHTPNITSIVRGTNKRRSGGVSCSNPAEHEDSTPDIMSLVSGTNRRRSGGVSCSNPTDKLLKKGDNGAGLRVKKIMRRAPEDESSKLENLRKEIREAVRSKTTQDLSKTDRFDPKLLLAFRNALAVPRSEHGPSKRLNPSIVRAKKSILQKGKIRENLTKKIYGNSNGKRKRAWDRDWEVEFWKHRCSRMTKPEKVDTLKSVLDLLRKNSDISEMEIEPEKDAANPILSRLYLADNSVFPRSDDVKPLSAVTGTVNGNHNSQNLLRTHTYSSQYLKDEGACKKVVTNGSINKQTSTSSASGSKVNDQSLTEMPGKSDVKIDKRKWALEVLARKTSTIQRNTSQGKEENNTALITKFPLLAQLPPDMRPVLAPSSHNKVPISVRQAQLNRLTEHFLRKTDLPVIRRTADTELAVADAVNIEKGVVNRSSSKLVYINLCSQALSQHINNNRLDNDAESDPSQSIVHVENIVPAPKEPSDLSAEAALRMAGLLSDSPPNSPCHLDVDDIDPSIGRGKEPPNMFDIDTQAELDIYGDFEYDLENEDYIGGIVPAVPKPHLEEGDSKLKVIFSTLKTQRTDEAMGPKDNDTVDIINEPKGSFGHELDKDRIISSDFRTDSSCPSQEPSVEEIDVEPSLEECEELYGPDKEPLIDRFPDPDSREADSSNGKDVLAAKVGPLKNANVIPNKTTSDFDTESCAEMARSEMSARCNSSGAENSSSRSLANEGRSLKEKKASKKKQSDVTRSVSKKVEAYIKEHVRPLCKSGVITVDQYRWAVERTTTKIMKYHSRDTNANFLIKEGEKVKKLAEQYVEAAQTKKDGF